MATHYSLKPGCSFLPFHNGSGSQEYIVRTADDRQFRISAAARQLLESLDQGVSLEQIYARMSAEQPDLTWAKLDNLIRSHYGALLVSENGASISAEASQPAKTRIILARTLLKKEIVRPIARFFSLLYSPVTASLFVAALVGAHIWLYTSFKSAPGARGHVFIVLVATLGSIIVHEFGHAAAVSRYGGQPGSIGIGLYILLPVFFADVSQVWGFQRRHRAIVDLGGVYFQQIAFLIFAVAAVRGHSPSFRAACLGIDIMTAIAINPVFRFDGYWVLVDWLGVPNLYKVAGQYLKLALSYLRHLKWASPDKIGLQLASIRAWVFVLYALIANPLFILFIFWNLRWIKSTFLSLTRQSPILFQQTIAALHGHDWIRTLDLITALLFLLASAVTVFVALFLRGRQVAGFIAARSSARRRSQAACTSKAFAEERKIS